MGVASVAALKRDFDPLAEIRLRLAHHPDLAIVDRGRSITVSTGAATGFDVWFSDAREEFVVGLGGWRGHFDKDEAELALEYFLFGLSDRCRVRVDSRAGIDYKWTVEALEDGAWVTDATTSIFWARFWRPKETRYLSNGTNETGSD